MLPHKHNAQDTLVHAYNNVFLAPFQYISDLFKCIQSHLIVFRTPSQCIPGPSEMHFRAFQNRISGPLKCILGPVEYTPAPLKMRFRRL